MSAELISRNSGLVAKSTFALMPAEGDALFMRSYMHVSSLTPRVLADFRNDDIISNAHDKHTSSETSNRAVQAVFANAYNAFLANHQVLTSRFSVSFCYALQSGHASKPVVDIYGFASDPPVRGETPSLLRIIGGLSPQSKSSHAISGYMTPSRHQTFFVGKAETPRIDMPDLVSWVLDLEAIHLIAKGNLPSYSAKTEKGMRLEGFLKAYPADPAVPAKVDNHSSVRYMLSNPSNLSMLDRI